MRYNKWDDDKKYFVPIQEQASDLTLGIVALDRKVSQTIDSLVKDFYETPKNISETPKNISRLGAFTGDFAKFCALGALDLVVKAVLYTVYWPIPSVYKNFIDLSRMNYEEDK